MLRRWTIVHGARADARLGLDSGEDRVTVELGPRPVFDAVGNPEHARLAVAQDGVVIAETREDLMRAEDAAERHASPTMLMAGVVVALAIETIGAVLITRALGLPPAERLPLGFALATAVIGITAVTAHRVPTVRGAIESHGSDGTTVVAVTKRSLVTLVVFAVYAALVVAITVVRLRNAGGEDSTELEALAESALMLATSLGPAWLAEWLIRRRAPAVSAVKRMRALRKRLREAERARARAQAAVDRIWHEGARWDAEAARRRARYRTEHRLEDAKVRTKTEAHD